MLERSSKENMQRKMAENAGKILLYLEGVLAIQGENPAQKMFDALRGKTSLKGNDNTSGRLFYEVKLFKSPEEPNIQSKENIQPKEKSKEQVIQEKFEEVFHDEVLNTYIAEQIQKVSLQLNEENFAFVKNLVDDLFQPVKDSQEWKSFYGIIQEEIGEDKAKELEEKIKGAFAYKVIGASVPQQQREPGKDKMLAKLFADYPNMQEAVKEYQDKIIWQLTSLKDEIFRKAEELSKATKKDDIENKAEYLKGLTNDLGHNILAVLEKPEFQSLGLHFQNDFIADRVMKILFEIKRELANKVVDADKLKTLYISLANAFTDIITKYNENGEFAKMDWNHKPSLLSMANFTAEHKRDFYREFHLHQHKDFFELLEAKVEEWKAQSKKNYQSKTATFFATTNDTSTEKPENKGEEKEERSSEQGPDFT